MKVSPSAEQVLGGEVMVLDEQEDVNMQLRSDISINWTTSSKLEYITSRILEQAYS
jgi:hypothetical protein